MTPPTHLGRYRILRVLGRGGMGVVYEGHDPQIERPVAIKTIALEALDAQEQALFESRFRSEMRSTGRLQHHNIAALYDAGRDGSTAYIVMELVHGRDLRQRLAAGETFSLNQALDILRQLLTALEFAHSRHVIHRDVKPANVMLQDDGVVKLCDFGVARLADPDATRTQGFVVGSLRYAAPEQITGRPVDERSDVFSAGVLAYELLTGQRPFAGQTDAEVLHRIATQAAPSALSVNPELPPAVAQAVQRALATEPSDRFASAAEFARALAEDSLAPPSTAAGLDPTVPDATRPARPVAPAKPTRRGAAVAVVGGLATVVAVGALWPLLRKAPAAPEAAVAAAPLAPGAGSSASPAPTPSLSPSLSPSPTPATSSSPSSSPSSSLSLTPSPATPVATSSSAPAATAAIQETKPPSVAVSGVPKGRWLATWACGPLLTRSGPGSGPFRAEFVIEVQGQRLSWVRESATVKVPMAGSFDSKNGFRIEGLGTRSDDNDSWREQATGRYDPKTQRIEGRGQLLTMRDQVVARDCTLVAARGAAPPVLALPPTAQAPSGRWAAKLACEASRNPKTTGARALPFTSSGVLEIAGKRLFWSRGDATFKETASGSFDAKGRFSVEGLGSDSSSATWRVRATGGFEPATRQLQAQANLLRPDDNFVTRDCTLRARLGGLEAQP